MFFAALYIWYCADNRVTLDDPWSLFLFIFVFLSPRDTTVELPTDEPRQLSLRQLSLRQLSLRTAEPPTVEPPDK